jgi:hypothetical protein
LELFYPREKLETIVIDDAVAEIIGMRPHVMIQIAPRHLRRETDDTAPPHHALADERIVGHKGVVADISGSLDDGIFKDFGVFAA